MWENCLLVWGKTPHVRIGLRIITGESHPHTKRVGKEEGAETMFSLGTVRPKMKRTVYEHHAPAEKSVSHRGMVSSFETIVNVHEVCTSESPRS